MAPNSLAYANSFCLASGGLKVKEHSVLISRIGIVHYGLAQMIMVGTQGLYGAATLSPGLVWMKTDTERSILEHSLLNAVYFTEATFLKLCHDLDVKSVKNAAGKIDRSSHVSAVVTKVLGDKLDQAPLCCM